MIKYAVPKYKVTRKGKIISSCYECDYFRFSCYGCHRCIRCYLPSPIEGSKSCHSQCAAVMEKKYKEYGDNNIYPKDNRDYVMFVFPDWCILEDLVFE